MTRPLPLRAAFLAAMLAAFSAPVRAADEPERIPADQLLPTMLAEISELRANAEKIPGPQARAKALEVLAKTEAEFGTRLKDLEGEKNYAVEAEYLGDWFDKFVLRPNQEAIRHATNLRLAPTVRLQRVNETYAAADQARVPFEARFYADHKETIDRIVALRIEERESSPVDENKPRRPEGRGQGIGAGLNEGIPDGMRKFQWMSPLIRAGRGAYFAATKPDEPVPAPAPIPGGGSGTGTGTGAGTGNGGASPNGDPGNAGTTPGGADGPSWSDIIRGNVPDLAPQALADGGVQALQGGNYAEAVNLAQLALQLNPNNRDAKGVLYSAQGRTAGSAATAAGVGAANAGAAALAPSAYDPGGVGGGGAAPAPSASFVSPGASRLITEQAVNGVKNAMRLGDAQSALEIVNKALSQDPNNPSLLNLRSQTYGYLGRWEEALKDASAGLAIAVRAGKGEPLALLNSLARAQNRTRRYGDALATSERMLAADPNNPWAFANRAYARGGLGDKAAMMADIGMAARLDPAFQRAAAEAAALTLPSSSDVLFLFPGEGGARPAPAPAPAGRGRSFGVVVGAGLVGGLLLALGLLSTVLAPLKNTVVSVFTKAQRTGPATTPAVATAQPASVAGNAGGLIRGQYEISRQIGQGGMGTVYEGTDRSLGRRVAIKKMRDELRVNPRERDRFIIEAKTVASLHHPNIVDIYAIAEEGEDVYLVFEYVDGKTVHDLVQTKGRLDAAEAVRVTRAMGEALTYAHSRGVIHRDMKPSNVMAAAGGQIKVMDFGIARMAKDALTRYSMTNTVVGTPPYMAPEQEQGVVRKESDVYSLAVCSYEMLTGKMPFIGIGAGMLMNKINMSYIPPSRAIAGLPEALDEVFVKAFQADPDRRYRTPLEFVTALSDAAGAGSKTV